MLSRIRIKIGDRSRVLADGCTFDNGQAKVWSHHVSQPPRATSSAGCRCNNGLSTSRVYLSVLDWIEQGL